MKLENIYKFIPVGFQNTLLTVYGFKIKCQRYNSEFYKILNDYELRLLLSAEELNYYRLERLKIFLFHCQANVPYYTALFKKYNFDARDVGAIQDIEILPILGKEEVKKNLQSFFPTNINQYSTVAMHTSGTTGSGLIFRATKSAIREQWAVWWRFRRMHKISIRTWCGYFGGRSIVPIGQKKGPFWRMNLAFNQVLFSGYHLSEDNFKSYVYALNKYKPTWLHGYPSMIALLANYMNAYNCKLDYQIKWITTGAENLLMHQNNQIQKAFGVSAIQHYGLTEAVANISQRPNGTMCVDEDFSIVEFVPGNNGSSKIVGTNISNFAFPLLRYETGDFAERNSDPGTDNDFRVVTKIDGRKEDYIELPSGVKIGRLDHVLKDQVNIMESQIYQKLKGALTVRVVKSAKYTRNDEMNLLSELRSRIGNDTAISVEYHEHIPKTQNGKLKFVVSELKDFK